MENTLKALQQSIAEMLNKDEVDVDATLAEIGIDSLNVVELILICEQVYPNCTNPETLTFDEHTTLREVDQQITTVSA